MNTGSEKLKKKNEKKKNIEREGYHKFGLTLLSYFQILYVLLMIHLDEK